MTEILFSTLQASLCANNHVLYLIIMYFTNKSVKKENKHFKHTLYHFILLN